MTSLFTEQRERLAHETLPQVTGRVIEVSGLTVIADGLPLPVGSLCRIDCAHAQPVEAQVVGVSQRQAVLMTLRQPQGVAAGDPVVGLLSRQVVRVGRQMVGSVLDGMGRLIGGRREFMVESQYPIYREAPTPLTRSPVRRVMPTGIRSIDAMHTIGGGQRLGIFAGTGVGKSVLMGMIARFSEADVIVVGLVGERGREVGDFLRKELGDEGMERCVLVVSTSDESPVLRARAAFTATAVAEYFRDQGGDVLLMLDSTTRMALAQREIGLAAGEPPTTKGFPPSVFSLLPKLLERSGATARGSITGLYTVLVEGDDMTEPISDAVRGILDGHVWLSRDLSNRGHYPALSVLDSISRVMPDIVDDEHLDASREVRKVLATWNDIEDLVNVGAYAAGTNVEFDVAVQTKPAIESFLAQSMTDRAAWRETREGLLHLAAEIRSVRERAVMQSNAAPVAQTA
jgi:FliI/YscN family ATPase